MIWVVVTTAPPIVNILLGSASARGLEVSQRSFMIPSRNRATPTMPSDLTSGSRASELRREPHAVQQRERRTHGDQRRVRQYSHAVTDRGRLAEAPAHQRPGDVGAHGTRWHRTPD